MNERCFECNEILFICEMNDMKLCDDCFEKIQSE